MQNTGTEVLSGRDERILYDKLANFKGTARIAIKHLTFPYPSRQIDRKIIEQLLRDFEGEGFRPEEPDHRIPAIVDDSVLEAALEKLPMSVDAFKANASNAPILNLDQETLECLHGQHRVLAAQEYNPTNRWWIVDLYGDGLNKDTKQALREGYSYSAKYHSGEIFRYMRLCQHNYDIPGVQGWRGRLSPTQDALLTKLLKRNMLVEALDSVLHIQGFWRGFCLGSLDVLLFLKCDEEIARSIRYMQMIWTRIFKGDMAALMNTDPATIQAIQSSAPALSKLDFEYVEKHMQSGKLFPGVTNSTMRADISQLLLTTEELIPTLNTLLKDIRYLKQPATILSTLLPKSPKPTLRQRYYRHFRAADSNTVQVQQSTSAYTTITNRLDAFDLSYQQLWLCSYRICKYPNAYGRRELALLAKQLGFLCPKIQLQLNRDPAQVEIEKLVREVLYILRPNEKIAFDTNQARPIIVSFQDYLNKLWKTPTETTSPPITTGRECRSQRCERGYMDTLDLNDLFLEKIHAPISTYRKDGDEISSFYVKRSRHIAFFGPITLTGNQESRGEKGVPPTYLIPASLSLHQIGTSEPTREPSNETPDETAGGSRAVVYESLVIKFMENGVVIQEVPFRKEDVNRHAKIHADQGKKLSLEQGLYFTWGECFDIITKTGKPVVTVSTVVEPWAGERGRGKELPDRLQPASKEPFDFDFDDEEE